MISFYDERAKRFADYIISNRSTVRDTAKKFGISKSTVHKDVTVRLERIDKALFENVRHVLDYNKAERHIRGGQATRDRYAKEKTAFHK